MSNKNSNVPYDQIPHIVINHPDTNPEHQAIMCALYKVLKDVSYPIIYSNEQLAINCKMSLRNVERRMPELNKMGFIICNGRGRSRRITLGLLFSTTAKLADGKSPTAKYKSPTAKSDTSNRQYGGHYNPSSNPSSKENLSFSPSLNQKTKTPKEKDFLYDPLYQEYVGRLKADKDMGLISANSELLSYEDWLAHANITQ